MEKTKESKLTYKEYNREEQFPGSHQCSHFTKTFKRLCERPAYIQDKKGEWWCEPCYIAYSGEVDEKTLPLYREKVNPR